MRILDSIKVSEKIWRASYESKIFHNPHSWKILLLTAWRQPYRSMVGTGEYLQWNMGEIGVVVQVTWKISTLSHKEMAIFQAPLLFWVTIGYFLCCQWNIHKSDTYHFQTKMTEITVLFLPSLFPSFLSREHWSLRDEGAIDWMCPRFLWFMEESLLLSWTYCIKL